MLGNNSLNKLLKEAKTRHSAVILKVIFGERSLFYEGVSTTFLEAFGKEPSIYLLVSDERRMSRQSLRRNVGIGSNKHNLVGDSLINLRTSSLLTGTKALKAAGTRSVASFKESEVENVSVILPILLEIKEANMSARL